MTSRTLYSYLAVCIVALAGQRCTEFGLKKTDTGKLSLISANSQLKDGASASVLLPSDLKYLNNALKIEDGSNLANSAVQNSLGMDSELKAAGPSVHIESKLDIKPEDIGRLQIQVPFTPVSGLKGDQYLVVIYAVRDANGRFQVGALPEGEGKGYTINETKLQLGLRGFGNYQAIYISVPLTEEKSVADDTISTKSKSQVEALPSMRIAKISPLVVSTGDKVTIKGSNLREGLRMSLNSAQFQDIKVVDAETAIATAPSSDTRGEARLNLYQQGVEFSTPMLFAGGIDDFPISTLPASELCLGVKFYNKDGVLDEGTRSCGVTLMECTGAGQTDCKATSTYPTMDKSTLTNATALSNTNFEGAVSSNAPFQFWGASGQRYQLNGDPDLIASNLSSGINIFGVVGNAALESHSLCVNDGQTGCVIGPHYAAALTTGLASKVLLGQTVAGVAGAASGEAHSNCSAANQTGCVATSDFKTMDLRLSSASITDLTSSGFDSTLASTASFEFWDSTGTRHQLVGDVDLVASKIASGTQIFGVNGTATLESHNSCSADGEVGCVVLGPSYAAAAKSGLQAKVLSGQTVAGVSGTAIQESHSNCTAANQMGCVATASYKTMDLTTSGSANALTAFNFASSLTSAANFEFWDASGARHQASGDIDLIPASLLTGIDVFGVVGTASPESHTDCNSDGGTGCVATASYPAAASNGLAAKVKSGQTVAGITGTVIEESHSNCTAANQSACIATTLYKTMDLSTASAMSDLTSGNFEASLRAAGSFEFWDSQGQRHQASGSSNLTAANIASGVTAFGITGTAGLEAHSNCTGPNQTACVATATYKTMDLSGASAISDLSLMTLNAALASPNAFEFWDSTGVRYQSTGSASLSAPNIASGTTLFGVVGSASLESHTPCTSANQQDCVATATYKTMDLSAASAMSDLTSSNFNSSLANSSSFEYWDSTGARHQSNGSSALLASNIAFGTSLFGVAGTAALESHSNCTGAGQSNCVATSTYKTMNLTSASVMADLTSSNLNSLLANASSFEFWDSGGNRYQSTGSTALSAANIKAGVNLFGVTGDYPSATFPLPSASAVADLDNATFDAKIKSSASFEYWTSSGVYQTGAGDADIDVANIKSGVTIFGATGTLSAAGLLCQHSTQANCEADSACQWVSGACSVDPWNIRIGKSIGGTSGQLKTTCRNRANSAIFNADTMPPGTVGTTAGSTIDWWDTIDDYANNGVFPTSLVAAWSSDTDCDRNVWRDLTADGACDAAADDCLMQDRISGLMWSESFPATGTAAAITTLDWSAAVSRCDALSYAGYTDWRLPTQKELQEAYGHGIRELGYKGSGTVRATGSLDNNNAFIADVDLFFWSATSISTTTVDAWLVYLYSGLTYNGNKYNNSAYQTLCVRP